MASQNPLQDNQGTDLREYIEGQEPLEFYTRLKLKSLKQRQITDVTMLLTQHGNVQWTSVINAHTVWHTPAGNYNIRFMTINTYV